MKRLLFFMFLGLGLGACAEAPEPTQSPDSGTGFLLNPFDWTEVDDDMDPFAARRPESWNCAPTAHFSEQLAGVWVYSIETGDCDWLTISQPTAVPLMVGDRVVINIWHFELVAPERAMAYLGVATRDNILIEIEEPIPSPARRVELSFTMTEALPASTPLFFHLNNHGANSWHLVEVLLNPETDEEE